jgi:hypothetical protein
MSAVLTAIAQPQVSNALGVIPPVHEMIEAAHRDGTKFCSITPSNHHAFRLAFHVVAACSLVKMMRTAILATVIEPKLALGLSSVRSGVR